MDFDLTAAFQQAGARITAWVEGAVAALPNLVVAVFVVVAFVLAARVLQRTVRRLVERLTTHGPVRDLIGTATYVGVLLLGVFVALGVMNLDRTVTSLLAGVGIIGLALGFAFQDLAENLIAGVLLSVRRPFTDGDLIETSGHLGIVESVDLRATTMRSLSGPTVRIPNSEVFKTPLVNYSAAGLRRVDVAVGVSYGDDLAEAARVAIEAVSPIEARSPEREIELFYTGFGASSIDFELRFWIPFRSQREYLAARSEAIQRVKRAFDDQGISIPFPIRTLDFSRVGTVTLSDELPGSEAG